MTNNTSSSVGLSSISGLHHPISVSKAESSTVTWAPTPDQKSSEIDRIMAKIEQARLSIANVCVLIRNHKFSQNILSFFLFLIFELSKIYSKLTQQQTLNEILVSI